MSKRSAVRAPWLLLTAGAIWGLAFVAQRVGMDHIGPFLFNGLRFLIGSAVLVPFFLYRRHRSSLRTSNQGFVNAPRSQTPLSEAAPKGPPRSHVIGLLLAGTVLFASASLQQIGMVYTTAGKGGFITGLYVVIVPFLGLFRGHRVQRHVWLAAIAAAVGTYLLSGAERLSLAPGDGWVFLGAIGWATHVHLVGWLADRVDTLKIAVTQFAVCGFLSLGVSLLVEDITTAGLVGAALPIAYAGFLSVGIAYTLQIVGQRHIDPSRAGILLSLEAVFAVLGGWLILGETLGVRAMIGCTLMLGGMMLAQIRTHKRALSGTGT